MKRAILVNLPKTDLIIPPAALGVLAGVCKESNVEYDFLDFNIVLSRHLTEEEWIHLDNWLTGVIEDCDKNILDKIDEKWNECLLSKVDSYDYMCVSVLSYWSIKIAIHLLSKTQQNNKFKIIVGGSGTNNNINGYSQNKVTLKEWLLSNKHADYVIYGDGEPEFAGILQQTNKLNYDINTFPIPNYKGINFDDYIGNSVFITGSRGCVRKCTFCDINDVWPKFNYRNAELVVEEIKKHYYELGVENFEFTDSLINGSVSNFYKFNVLLAEEKEKNIDLKNITYSGQFIARAKRQMPPSHYEAMYYAGCKQVTVGIESFSEQVRDEMKKKFSNSDLEYHMKQCARWSIGNVWLMIVGYPTEKLEDHYENLKGIEKFAPYAKTGALELIRWGTTLHYIDGTPLTRPDMLEKYGIYDPSVDSANRPGSSYTWKSRINPDLTVKERVRRRLEIHKHTVKYNIPQARALEDLKILDKMLDLS